MTVACTKLVTRDRRCEGLGGECWWEGVGESAGDGIGESAGEGVGESAGGRGRGRVLVGDGQF